AVGLPDAGLDVVDEGQAEVLTTAAGSAVDGSHLEVVPLERSGLPLIGEPAPGLWDLLVKILEVGVELGEEPGLLVAPVGIQTHRDRLGVLVPEHAELGRGQLKGLLELVILAGQVALVGSLERLDQDSRQL